MSKYFRFIVFFCYLKRSAIQQQLGRSPSQQQQQQQQHQQNMNLMAQSPYGTSRYNTVNQQQQQQQQQLQQQQNMMALMRSPSNQLTQQQSAGGLRNPFQQQQLTNDVNYFLF